MSVITETILSPSFCSGYPTMFASLDASLDNPPDALIWVMKVFVVPASKTDTETSVTVPVKIVVSTPEKFSSVIDTSSKISTSV